MEKISLEVNSVPCFNITEDSYANLSPSKIDDLVDITGSLHMTLNSTTPLKKKITKNRRRAPWYNPQIHGLKQMSIKLEIKWRATNLEEERPPLE